MRRVALALLLTLAALAAVYVSLVVYPTPFFRYSQQADGYRLYSDRPIPTELHGVAAEARKRVESMEHDPGDVPPRVYLCHSPRRYAFYAFLTRKSPQSLAIGLSLANEMFVSVSRVRQFAARNQGRLRHTRFEGNLAEVLAHVIAHFHSARVLGYRVHLGLPVWKSEGWAEYQANLQAIRRDPQYDLGRRIDQLLDPTLWASGSGLARDLWEWQLLVEFLGQVHGYRLADLARPEVTRHGVRQRMLTWHRHRLPTASGPTNELLTGPGTAVTGSAPPSSGSPPGS